MSSNTTPGDGGDVDQISAKFQPALNIAETPGDEQPAAPATQTTTTTTTTPQQTAGATQPTPATQQVTTPTQSNPQTPTVAPGSVLYPLI